MKTVYEAKVGGDVRLVFRADFAQASSPIEIEGEDGFNSTPYQVADARHKVREAADMLNGWCYSQGGEAWGEDEDVTVAARK